VSKVQSGKKGITCKHNLETGELVEDGSEAMARIELELCHGVNHGTNS
jgi:hypothetical protein